MKAKPKKRNPLEKYKLPTQAGKSSLDTMNDFVFDKFMTWVLLAGLMLAMFFMELYGWWVELPRMPWIYLLLLVVAGLVAVWRFRRLAPKYRAMKRGWQGELAVGYLLEQLRLHGYYILHDLDCGKGGNIDHVVLGPAGVFAIETKTYSKPGAQEARIRYYGHRLQIPGVSEKMLNDKDPIRQAKRVAALGADLVKGVTGRSVFVKPIVLFPGWWVDEHLNADVWVMNPERFVKQVQSMPARLSSNDRDFIFERLLRHQADAT